MTAEQVKGLQLGQKIRRGDEPIMTVDKCVGSTKAHYIRIKNRFGDRIRLTQKEAMAFELVEK